MSSLKSNFIKLGFVLVGIVFLLIALTMALVA